MTRLENMTAAQRANYNARLERARLVRAASGRGEALRAKQAAARATKNAQKLDAKHERERMRAQLKALKDAARAAKPKRVLTEAQRAVALRNLEKARAAREARRMLGAFNL